VLHWVWHDVLAVQDTKAFIGGAGQHMDPPQAWTIPQVQLAGDPEHVGVPPPQTVVHVPQWLAVLSWVSQPGALVQSPQVLSHEAIAHVPLAQVAVACAWVHVIPHPPQLLFVVVAVSQPSVSTAPLEQFA
jgi:hypothetical protein